MRRIGVKGSGSALLVVLIIAGLLAVAVGTYLALTSQGNSNVKRSMGWNAALPLAEAGVEEALSHIMRNTNAFGKDGWTSSSEGFAKQRLLGDGHYSVNIAGFPGGMVFITSTGFGAWRASNFVARTVQVVAQTPAPSCRSGSWRQISRLEATLERIVSIRRTHSTVLAECMTRGRRQLW